MKKVITLILLMLIFASKITFADVHPINAVLPTYQLKLKNDTLLTSKTYRFEVWISSVSSNRVMDLRSFQCGIGYNTAMINGGTISASVNYTGSALLAFSDMSPQTINAATAGTLKLATKAGATTSHIVIPSTGVDYKLVTITITNTVNFAMVKPNLTWLFTTSPYPTKVFAYLNSASDSTQFLVTLPSGNPGSVIQSWHINNVVNPIFNQVPTVYNVGGTGTYCSTGGGPITLSNSEIGVSYQLFKNAVASGLPIAGTGSALSFPNNTLGTYTIEATRNATALTSTMNGSAILTETIGLPGTAGLVTGNTTICQGNPGETYNVPLITNAESYVWEYSGTGVTINGTTNSAVVNFSANAVSGNLTVKGQNACGLGTASTPLAIIISNLPDAAGTITGSSTVSPGQLAIAYNVPLINGATSYTWVYSGLGATINGTTNAVTIDFGANATPGFLTVKGTNPCGNGVVSADFAINVNSIPGAAGTITGVTSVCPGQNNVIFTVPAILGANTYLWEYSGTGVTIDSTLGDTAYINFAANATLGNLTVKGNNSFGYGASSPNFAIVINSFPVAAGIIGGLDTVCKNTNNVMFTVPTILHATNYIWTLPSGATGSSTTNSILVNFGTSAVNGNIVVKGNNVCGDGATSSKAITINTIPSNAGTISGLSPVCQGTNNLTYTVPAITGATSYIWTLPSGVTGSSTTSSITANVSLTSTGGQITVKGSNACGNGIASAMSLTVNPLPSAAGVISGLNTVCQGQSGVTYTVPSITNATSYIWTKPNGTTGSSTTNTITLGYSTTAISGDITVKGNNACGQGNTSTLAVTVNPLPGNASAITGLTTVCKGVTGVVYKTAPISNATSYSWTLPTGVTGTSTVDSIVVDYTSAAVSGNIIVKGVNACGDGVSSTIAVTVNDVPVPAGVIAGNASVCQGQTNITYTVPVISGAASYTWTLPTGFTGTSITNSIAVNIANNAPSGSISVLGSNTCGLGTSSSIAVTVNATPDTASTITGTLTVCQGQTNVTYTVPSINNATAYSWTLPAGASGSSTTNSITLSFATFAVSGNLKVKGQNACGFGQESQIAITVNPLPSNAGTIAGNALVCKGQTNLTYKVAAINNATSYEWTYPTGFTGTSTVDSIVLTAGPTSVSGNITVKGQNACGFGTQSTKAVTVNTIPNPPAAINGADTVCQGAQNQLYSATTTPGATSYTWKLYNGATGSSTNSSIFVSFGATATSANIVVKANNVCGTSDSTYKMIIVRPSAGAAGTITGPAAICAGATNVVYTVPAITGATSYVWTLPAGVTGNSSTNSITVAFAGSIVPGSISVYGASACGDGTPSSIAFTVTALPGAAGIITSVGGDSIIVAGSKSYTVPAITGATSYIWSYTGTGATITGTTNTVSITFLANFTNGILTVTGQNACGNGTVSAGYNITNYVGINDPDGNSLNYSIYPNPTKGIITVNINGINSKLELQITNLQGEVIRTEKLTNDKQSYSTDIDLSSYAKGIYFVKIINSTFVKVEKVILQ